MLLPLAVAYHESDEESVLKELGRLQLKEGFSGEESTDPEWAIQRQIDQKEGQNREMKLVRSQMEKEKQIRIMKLEIMNEVRDRDRQRMRDQEQQDKEKQEWSDEVLQFEAWVKDLREEKTKLEQEKQNETKVLMELKEHIAAMEEEKSWRDQQAQRIMRQDLTVTKQIIDKKDDRKTAKLREELANLQQRHLEMNTERETEIVERVEREVAHLLAERDEAEKMVKELQDD
jgi:hypothetical protein